MENKE
jgi:phosphoglycerate kinase